MVTDIMLYTENKLAIGQNFYFMLYPTGNAVHTTVVVDEFENVHIQNSLIKCTKESILTDFE